MINIFKEVLGTSRERNSVKNIRQPKRLFFAPQKWSVSLWLKNKKVQENQKCGKERITIQILIYCRRGVVDTINLKTIWQKVITLTYTHGKLWGVTQAHPQNPWGPWLPGRIAEFLRKWFIMKGSLLAQDVLVNISSGAACSPRWEQCASPTALQFEMT